MDIENLKKGFFDRYGNPESKPRLFFSPGRVNLIGEHTDYNNGFVFPCALDVGTYLLIRKTDDNTISFASENETLEKKVPLDKISEKQGHEWVNYPLGVFNEMNAKGVKLSGLEMYFSGNIPSGAGLSSSASIELVTAFATNVLFNGGLPVLELVKMGQRAENNFVGVNCGIMDQFAVGLGEKDHALALNCDTLDYEKVPVNLGNHTIVIANTNKKRGLADSKYNERRSECEKAVEYISKEKTLEHLSQLDAEMFERLKENIPEENVVRRAKHVIYENKRVLDAVKALKENDLDTFGKLMYQSHYSLKDDYEVTGLELDTLVEEATKIDGVIGARMTGAGFGGCTVNIVKTEKVELFKNHVGKGYYERTGLTPEFYTANIADGVKEMDL